MKSSNHRLTLDRIHHSRALRKDDTLVEAEQLDQATYQGQGRQADQRGRKYHRFDLNKILGRRAKQTHMLKKLNTNSGGRNRDFA